MLLSIICFVVGIALVIFGADWLTKGASDLARHLKMSELMIGLTIVAIGTSLPELVISVSSALSGNSGISLGNVLGSNIFNGMLILGTTALITPIVFSGKMLSRELPFNLLASVVVLLVSGSMLVGGAPGEYITRYNGLILLCFCAVFVRYTFSLRGNEEDTAAQQPMSMGKILLFIAGGLAGLIIGGKMFVSGASDIARGFGLSEALIGITIVSVGSSLPELAVSVNAARKGNVGIALGNVLGSNILNVFFILGCSATISPISLEGFTPVDYYVLLASSLFIYLFCAFFGKNKITRWEGGLLVAGYVAYVVYLIMGI
ncbi:MAG: calcium/sodium antiporter [Bacteroidaceae bacterium]|nr:calcium/sodium antiporter [Bacteroidaceae bacterium]MBP3408760.1 calcium/sodium antiporter [Bacteroidaceae bacterium]